MYILYTVESTDYQAGLLSDSIFSILLIIGIMVFCFVKIFVIELLIKQINLKSITMECKLQSNEKRLTYRKNVVSKK